MDGDPRPKRKRTQQFIRQQKKRPDGVRFSMTESSPVGTHPGA